MSNKPTIAVAIDSDLLEWIDEQIAKKKFANRSHAIQYCIYETREREKQ